MGEVAEKMNISLSDYRKPFLDLAKNQLKD